MVNEPIAPYTLVDLAQRTDIPERTIRSYIGRGLLPPPEGRGRGATYNAEHLLRLQFIVRVRAALPYEVPLALLERLLRELPREQIENIANGREGVVAVPILSEIDPSVLRRKRDEGTVARANLAVEPAVYVAGPSVREQRRPDLHTGPAGPETWTTFHVTPDVRLSMRGPAQNTARSLTELAERLRAWLVQGGEK